MPAEPGVPGRPRPRGTAWASRFVDLRPGEGQALAWSWLYVFALFLAYYVLRPIRDSWGVAGGVDNLPWLFTATFGAMLAVNPLFAWAVRRWPRDRFIAVAYRFFMANILGFAALLAWAPAGENVWVGRAFFVWISVFNLFVVSVFWSFIVDVFDAEQGKRLFGILAAGATLGGVAGSVLTARSVAALGQMPLLLASVALLEVAVLATRRLSRISDAFRRPHDAADPHRPIGGGLLSGMGRTLRSPYLFGLAAFVVLYSATSTILYFQQATIAADAYPNRADRTAFFASIDLWVNVLTLGVQVLLTGRLIRWLGVAAILCALPLFSAAGFAALAGRPTIGIFVVVQVARRVANFALARPAREILFTAVSREDRYKAKTFIDTVIYRGGDQVGSWLYAGLLALGLGLTGISLAAVPFSLAWLALALWLGRTGAVEAVSVQRRAWAGR